MSSGLMHFKRRLLPRFLSPFCAYAGDFSLFCIHKDMVSISRVYALPFYYSDIGAKWQKMRSVE